MTKQITIEEALKLVEFDHIRDRGWQVGSIKGSVHGDVNGVVCGSVAGDVRGSVFGSVRRNVGGSVFGDVGGDVGGHVYGKIDGRKWYFAETPKEKLQRLVKENAGIGELLAAINQLEDS